MRRAGPDVERVKKTSIGSAESRTGSFSPQREHINSGRVHETYLIGLSTGAGVAFGLLAAGLLARAPRGTAALVAAAVGAILGLLVFGWPEAAAAAVGGVLGGAAAATFVSGTLRRGGSGAATAFLFVLVAAGTFVLALIPVAGFLEAAALPVLAARARSRGGEKFAGLRTLAR